MLRSDLRHPNTNVMLSLSFAYGHVLDVGRYDDDSLRLNSNAHYSGNCGIISWVSYGHFEAIVKTLWGQFFYQHRQNRGKEGKKKNCVILCPTIAWVFSFLVITGKISTRWSPPISYF